jgi:hypothetical protein
MSSTFFSTTSFAGADPAVAAAISVRASRKVAGKTWSWSTAATQRNHVEAHLVNY